MMVVRSIALTEAEDVKVGWENIGGEVRHGGQE